MGSALLLDIQQAETPNKMTCKVIVLLSLKFHEDKLPLSYVFVVVSKLILIKGTTQD
jgi:hypothetical protein